MKRKFSLIAAFIASVMFIAIGCSNANNITFQDGGNQGYQGLSSVKISLGKLPSYRAIYPNDISEEKKAALIYKLYGNDSSTTSVNLSKGVVLKYADLNKGGAVVELDPITWDELTLKAFAVSDEVNPILVGTKTNVDLSGGNGEVIFNLNPVTDGKVDGTVDITVNFYNEVGKEAKSVALDIVDLETGKTSKISGPFYIDTFTDKNGELKQVGLTSSTPSFDGNVKSGKYYFKATFYDNTSENVKKKTANIMSQYMTYLQVDAGNTSKATITIPKGTFNSKPTAPTGLAASCNFDPNGGKITIDESTKDYAQQVEVLVADSPVASANKYNVVFTWTDTSYNESEFVLKFTEKKTSQVITISDDPSSADKAKVTVGAGVENTLGIDVVANSGNMQADCHSVTVSIPVGVFIDNISVEAKNGFGNSEPNNLELSGSQVGMFTIAYDVQQNSVNGQINLGGSSVPTDKRYVVLAYNYGAKDKLITKDKVSHASYSFASWKEEPAKEVTTLEDLTKKNTNQTLTGNWLNPTTIKVTYPSYTAYKDFAIIKESGISEDNKIKPVGTLTLTVPDVKEGEKIENVSFKIYDPNPTKDSVTLFKSTGTDQQKQLANSVTTAKMTVGAGASITWDINEFKKTYPNGNIYRLEISYDYAPSLGARAVRKDGIFYIDIQ